MLRALLIAASMGSIVLALTLAACGVFIAYKLSGGQAIDLCIVGDWWFQLRSDGLCIIHVNRVLFTVDPFMLALLLAVLPGFHMILLNARYRRARKRGFSVDAGSDAA